VACEQVENRGVARAVGADDPEDLARFQAQVVTLDRMKTLEDLREIVDFEQVLLLTDCRGMHAAGIL
jgi:hypothetical protein